jgi:hypothetical protein
VRVRARCTQVGGRQTKRLQNLFGEVGLGVRFGEFAQGASDAL